MLYAGSIAANNSKLPMPDENGLVGINPSEADRYYQMSLDASRALLPAPFGSGSFALRPGGNTSTYRDIFTDVGSGSDTESIMIQRFNGLGGKVNDHEILFLPRAEQNHVNWGAVVNVYLHNFEWFEYRDGTPGTMLPDGSAPLRDNIGAGIFYDLDQLFADKDPRMDASIAYPGFSINGSPAYFHRSVTDPAAAAAAGVPTSSPGQNRNKSAACVYKRANERNPSYVFGDGANSLIIFRIAEIYLNYAEAAFGLNQTATALDAVNAIRSRAGISTLTTIDIDAIKQERKVELIFEQHRFWDLRRWRDAEPILSVNNPGVHFDYDVANGTYAIVPRTNTDTHQRLFKPEDYYLPIPLSEIQSNDALIQNPGFRL